MSGPEDRRRRLPRGFVVAFALTWLSYASYYLGRKGYAVAKTQLAGTYGVEATYGVETVYLAAYAIGQYVSGRVGDRIGARRLVGVGMLSDRVTGVSRAALSAGSLVSLAAAFVLYNYVGSAGVGSNFAAMALIGALLFGPDALLSGVATQEVGGPAAAAMAAGVVNGIGSLGAILQEVVTRAVSARFG